ncbi:hypothetical protein ZIOFF_065537 [Zingiber officinale]|uniref:Uncharacterized protein n=1 Tax=Zingiber officinale TaxID=94328 RepID=A0A8J5KD84_ZINOF|nr:hypothetical protein ZIOFF_065537 [Zingiber officinale]
MAELDALLHEMGIANKDNKKQLEQSSEGEKKESVGAPSENRILKKKKSKKEKSSKEQEEHDQNQQKGDIEAEVADATAVDVKERIKKVASMRKKKSSKEMDVEHSAPGSETTTRRGRAPAGARGSHRKEERRRHNGGKCKGSASDQARVGDRCGGLVAVGRKATCVVDRSRHGSSVVNIGDGGGGSPTNVRATAGKRDAGVGARR